MELIGRKLGLPTECCDNLFIVGMFSLLDVLFEMPMDRLLEHLHLPEDIKQALENHQGRYGPYLKLVEACEDARLDNIEALAQSVGISAETLNLAHIEALTWVEDLGL